jgi:nitrite reductase/ring-hydroxylating ferredoxin subunit
MRHEGIMSHFDPQVLRYLPADRLAEHLKELHPGMVVTHGHHESLVPGYVNDLEWNFYDELHRQCVHDTYHGLYKVMTGKYFSINVVRWGNLPIFMQVANAKIMDGMFYQSMTVLGLIMLHQVQRISQKQDEVLIEVDWYTASHWMFRWLHGPFNRRLLKLQRKQDIEDNIEIRGRRRELRHRNFHFATDDPDFINSNRLTDNVRLPPLPAPLRIDLSGYAIGRMYRVAQGPVELLIRRKSEHQVEVWPALCPHEGGLMGEQHLCDGQLVCPWHGRRFGAALLGSGGRDSWRYLSVVVRYRGDHLEVAEAATAEPAKPAEVAGADHS